MKKTLAMLFAALALGGNLAAHAADAPADPRLEEVAELRVQAAKAAMQADELLKRAQDIEMSVAEDLAKNADKTRGRRYPYQCVENCLTSRRGDLYTCQRACGAF